MMIDKLYKIKRKNIATILLIEMTVEKYAKKYKITFNEAFTKFVSCGMYDAMMGDYGTNYLQEGPDYLVSELEDYIEDD